MQDKIEDITPNEKSNTKLIPPYEKITERELPEKNPRVIRQNKMF